MSTITNRRVVERFALAVSTYFVTLFEALSLDSRLCVGVDSDAWRVLGSEYIVDLANKLLVLSPDHTGEQGNAVALHHTDDLSFTNM